MEMDFLTQVLEYIKNFGGLETVLKISGAIALVISSMKVTFLKELLWDKMGSWKVLVAPVLGLIAGLVALGVAGAPFTFAAISAYVFSGAGAVIVHEILDAVKTLPGISAGVLKVVDLLKLIFGGK